MKRYQSLLATALGVILLIGVGLLPATWSAQAAPEQVRTEVATLNSAAITTTTNFGGNRWSALGVDDPPTTAEVYLFIDVGTVNTTTFTLQVSPDNSTWVNHSSAATLTSAVVTNTNTYSRTTIEGIYYRVRAVTSNSNQITPTIKVVTR